MSMINKELVSGGIKIAKKALPYLIAAATSVGEVIAEQNRKKEIETLKKAVSELQKK